MLYCVNHILNQIEHTRDEMIKSALENGIADENTILLSKKLDVLLNEIQIISNEYQ